MVVLVLLWPEEPECILGLSHFPVNGSQKNAYGRNAGLRIDHFLLDPQLKKRLKAAGVDHEVRGWEKTSEHAPVWEELSE